MIKFCEKEYFYFLLVYKRIKTVLRNFKKWEKTSIKTFINGIFLVIDKITIIEIINIIFNSTCYYMKYIFNVITLESKSYFIYV